MPRFLYKSAEPRLGTSASLLSLSLLSPPTPSSSPRAQEHLHYVVRNEIHRIALLSAGRPFVIWSLVSQSIPGMGQRRAFTFDDDVDLGLDYRWNSGD